LARFPDGEINLKVECDVRGADVFVVQPTCPNVHEHLFELLSFADCLRRASADRITAVIPYFGYARKDRKDEGRVPINAKLVANLLVTAGYNRVVAIDLHAAQIQGFFDIPVDHLYARPVMIDRVRQLDTKDVMIVSPDIGGTKLARAYAKDLGCDLAIIDKRRISGEQTVIEHVVGDVKNRDVVLVDDMVSDRRLDRRRGPHRQGEGRAQGVHRRHARRAVRQRRAAPQQRRRREDPVRGHRAAARQEDRPARSRARWRSCWRARSIASTAARASASCSRASVEFAPPAFQPIPHSSTSRIHRKR
jgi:hypothetical protein